jgi:hypothetical protein
MSKRRRILILGTLLVVTIGAVVCYDMYRAQTVAITVLDEARLGRVSSLTPMLSSDSITNRLFKDIEPFAQTIPLVQAPKEKGFLNRMLEEGSKVLGLKPKVVESKPDIGPDPHVCAQLLGESKGFSTLIKTLKPDPVKRGLLPDARIRYGGLNARQYMISKGNYLVVSRRNLLDWHITGVVLTEPVKRKIAQTCVGAL